MSNKIKALLILAGILDIAIVLMTLQMSMELAIGLTIIEGFCIFIVYNLMSQYNETEDIDS
jgi:hypothetical protein